MTRSIGAADAAFEVSVTPIKATKLDIECEINGEHVTDNAIFLERGKSYDITFNLGPNANYTFSANPFCNQRGHCPKTPKKGGSANRGYHVRDNGKNNGGKSITVTVDRVNQTTVTHYRLNFEGGYSCDPIIINN